LGLIPRLNDSTSTSIPANKASALYNDVLSGGIAFLRDFNRDKRLQISRLDVFALFYCILAAPSKYSLVNVTDSSLGHCGRSGHLSLLG
jgi:phospholipase/lecithinase/hemolysin